MGMHGVVVLDPGIDQSKSGSGVGDRADADLVALEGFDEGLGHAVAFRTFDLSPVFHPGMSRVGWSFESAWLGTATGRGAEPPISRSYRCDAGALSLAQSAGGRLPML